MKCWRYTSDRGPRCASKQQVCSEGDRYHTGNCDTEQRVLRSIVIDTAGLYREDT